MIQTFIYFKYPTLNVTVYCEYGKKTIKFVDLLVLKNFKNNGLLESLHLEI